ncbi:MAG TPA: methyltransferase domain-containing protein [Caulobacteraceae bacterium]
MTELPRIFDRALHRRRLDRAARRFGGADFLVGRAAVDLAARLRMVNRAFPIAVEMGARQGVLRRVLEGERARVGLLVETALSEVMLRRTGGIRVVADEERLPLAPQAVDLIVSALSLHWINDLVGCLIQVRRALRPDGLFIGSLLGGATLTELRQVLLEAEIEILGGAGPRVSPFADAYDCAALLQRAGFALPVVDVDTVRVRYDHPLKLLADLRAMGETSVLVQRPAALSREVLRRACEFYLRRFSGADGRITATFEILALTGWAPRPGQ